MRIFITFHPSGNATVKNSMTWYRNLYKPLVDLEHDLFLLRIDLVAKKLGLGHKLKTFKEKFSHILLDTFKNEHLKKPFDLFFSYFWDYTIDPLVIEEIKKLGVPTANFSCNNAHQFYLTEHIAPHFDYNLHSERDVGEKFKSIGAKPIWFPMAANPKYYHPIEAKKTIDVLFIGAAYAKRPYYIWNLLENGIDSHVYGPGWRKKEELAVLRKVKQELVRGKDIISSIFTFSPERRARISSRIASIDFNAKLFSKYNPNLHFPISDDKMIQKYSESKIVLGFLEVYDMHDYSKKSLQHLHLREFEVPMCGSLYFTNYSDELAEFYEPDKEVVIFRNEYELVDKIKYYLSHPEESEKVRHRGYKRAIKCHTYQKRFEELFSKIFN